MGRLGVRVRLLGFYRDHTAESLTSRLPLAIVIVSIIALAVTDSLFSWSPFVIAAQVGAFALAQWARWSFPKDAFRVEAAPAGQAVMRHGPYRFIRHPMYSAVLMFMWAGILGHRSLWSAAAGAGVTALVAARIVAEERLLRARYADYMDYVRSTKALIPFII